MVLALRGCALIFKLLLHALLQKLEGVLINHQASKLIHNGRVSPSQLSCLLGVIIQANVKVTKLATAVDTKKKSILTDLSVTVPKFTGKLPGTKTFVGLTRFHPSEQLIT